MASSNKHWPSLFKKTKACNAHHQGHHDTINSSTSLLSSASQKPSCSTPGHTGILLPGFEERSCPEPKPRWNPKPEQIRILEAIFNSGMVNPPRDEIRRIRAQLQEYGQVGDANVFYWFQNRKSRSKQKQRHVGTRAPPQSRINPTGNAAASPPRPTASAAAASSSSSSERSSAGSADKITVLHGTTTSLSTVTAAAVDASNSPTASVNQNFLHGDFFPEPFYFHANTPQSCCLTSVADFPGLIVPEQALGLCAGLFSELPGQQILGFKVGEDGVETNSALYSYGQSAAAAATAAVVTAVTNPATATTTATGAYSATNSDSTIAGHIGGIVQGMGSNGAARSTTSVVFINEVAFEVGLGLVNVREAFGEEAVLLHSSGDPVPVDERGVTFHPLQNGASYYLV